MISEEYEKRTDQREHQFRRRRDLTSHDSRNTPSQDLRFEDISNHVKNGVVLPDYLPAQTLVFTPLGKANKRVRMRVKHHRVWLLTNATPSSVQHCLKHFVFHYLDIEQTF